MNDEPEDDSPPPSPAELVDRRAHAMLIAAYRVRIVGEYRHPVWLAAAGVVVAVAMAALGVRAILSVDL